MTLIPYLDRSEDSDKRTRPVLTCPIDIQPLLYAILGWVPGTTKAQLIKGTTKAMLVALILLGIWAVAATLMLFVRNPLPFPDRGHRTFGVPDTKAQRAVVEVLSEVGLPLRFRFKSGPLDQALLWDNTTVIHFLDPSFHHSGNGISVAVADPEAAASKATHQLEKAGYSVNRMEGTDKGLSPNHIVVLTSTAFSGWALVFRRHVLKMPKPTFIPLDF